MIFFNLLVPLFLFVSCGIDYYIYLYPVVDRNPDPCTTYDIYDPSSNLFGFKTRDSVNSPISNYQGYMVYYRIYNNSDTMLSDMNYINNYNSNDDYKANIISYIENRNFKRLYCENQSFAAPLINKSGSDRTIKIRLVTEQGKDDNPGITVDDVINLGIPIRNTSSSPYNPEYFFDTDKFSQDDTDISFTQGDVNFEDVDTWYVSAYVLTYGIDDVYSPVYSSALWLGCSVIKVDEEDKS